MPRPQRVRVSIRRIFDMTILTSVGACSGLDKPVISSWELSTDTITDGIDVYKLTDITIKQREPIKEKIIEVRKSHNSLPGWESC